MLYFTIFNVVFYTYIVKISQHVFFERSQMKLNTNPGSLRAQYTLEKERIEYELGDLLKIRLTLGLSQRKLCKLLLVDPSAWTRWNKTGAPPHIYQALNWLLQLKKLNPEVIAPNDVSSRIDFIQASTETKIKDLESSVAMLERALTLTQSAAPQISNSTALADQEAFYLKKVTKLENELKKLSANKKMANKKMLKKPKALLKKPKRKILGKKTASKLKKIKNKKQKNKKIVKSKLLNKKIIRRPK